MTSIINYINRHCADIVLGIILLLFLSSMIGFFAYAIYETHNSTTDIWNVTHSQQCIVNGEVSYFLINARNDQTGVEKQFVTEIKDISPARYIFKHKYSQEHPHRLILQAIQIAEGQSIPIF